MHNFDVNSAGLPNGDYTGYIKITSNGGSASIPVNLTVGSGSDLPKTVSRNVSLLNNLNHHIPARYPHT